MKAMFVYSDIDPMASLNEKLSKHMSELQMVGKQADIACSKH